MSERSKRIIDELTTMIPLILSKYIMHGQPVMYHNITASDAQQIYSIIVKHSSSINDILNLYNWFEHSNLPPIWWDSAPFDICRGNLSVFLYHFYTEKKHFKLLYKMIINLKILHKKKTEGNY